MRIRIGGKYWDLTFKELDPEIGGECDSPDTTNKQIRICTDNNGKELLEVILHELLHASDWSKDEEWVEEIAYDIAHVLWKLGWRRTKS
jgi:hypothetical protein